MAFSAQNILVIDFGQLGDVVLSLPALAALRKRFPTAQITALIGKAGVAVVEMSGYTDKQIVVDRVALRDGYKAVSVWRIGRLVWAVRQHKFDFVIDLHSLAETNWLGLLTGAPVRLYARRRGRGVDWLGNFTPPPPLEPEGHTRHLVDRYLDVLQPLGVTNAPREPRLFPRPADVAIIAQLLQKEKVSSSELVIVLAPGAGHPGRRWPLENFAELAHRLHNGGLRVVVSLGPEERELRPAIAQTFPHKAVIFDRLTLPQLAALIERASVFVGNDTGPMHVAAAVGVPVVALFDRPTPHSFTPVGAQHQLIFRDSIKNIGVGEVHTAVLERLARQRFS